MVGLECLSHCFEFFELVSAFICFFSISGHHLSIFVNRSLILSQFIQEEILNVSIFYVFILRQDRQDQQWR